MPEQTWGDEAFTDGATVYGTCPGVYLSVEPWSPSPLAPGGSGLSLDCDEGHLHDALQKALNRGEGFAVGTLRLTPSGAAAWFVERQNVLDEGAVSFVPGIAPLGGVPGGDTYKQFGVCSHVSGGTLVTPGSDVTNEYHQNVSGWFLIESKQEGARARIALIELVSGAATVLASELVQETDPVQAGSAPSDYFVPQPIRMSITANGANREIRCYRKIQDGPEAHLFDEATFVRTALPDGRSGFGVQTYREDNGGCKSIGIANSFRIQDAAGAILFEDRFRRVQRLAAGAYSIPDGSGSYDDGRCLMQAWVGDARSATGISGIKFADTIARDTATANQVVSGNNVSGTTDDWPGFMIRQTAPATTSAQRVAATIIRLAQDTTTRTETGVAVRFNLLTINPLNDSIDPRGRLTFTPQRSGWLKDGYAVYVVHDVNATPVWQLEIRHFEGTNDITYEGVLLATADLTTSGLAVGAAFELDVEVRSFDGDTFGIGGFVVIEAKVDSTTITPVPVSGLTGVREIDDLLLDTRTEATQEGAVGLYHNPDALGAGDLVAFLDFAERAVTDPPVIDPAEQASVSVDSEAANKSGTLTLPVGAQIVETSETRAVRHRFESGKVQTIGTQAQARRRWSVDAAVERADWFALVNLLESNGSAVPFDWTHPYTGEALVVRFADDTVDLGGQVMMGTTVVYSTGFVLEEIFEAATYNAGA